MRKALPSVARDTKQTAKVRIIGKYIMKKNMTIRIKRRTQPQWLIWVLVMLPFIFSTLIELLRFPNAVRYVLDIAWLALVVMLLRFNHLIHKTRKTFMIWIILFFFYTLFAYLPNYQSALYYLWGFRNNFRMYVLFLAVATFMTSVDGEYFLEIFDKLFWINVVVSLIQYFGLGYSGDFLGGIFGTEMGANAYTNIFFSIVLTRSLIFYLEKKEETWTCVSKCVAGLTVCVLAELKFFFIEFLLIIAMTVLLTDFTWRKFWVAAGGILAVFAGAILLSVLFPTFAGWFSVEWILSSALSNRGYTYSGDLNRLNAITRINDMWLRGLPGRLFGMGLGNCDTSSFAVLNTPFYRQHGRMHYTWLSHAHIYLECGWIGLLFYFGFFVLVYICAGKVLKRSEGIKNTFSRMAMIMAVICMATSIYNGSLRTEAAYMAYFVLALPFTKSIGNPTPQRKERI